MNLFEWIFNKKELETELDNLDRNLDIEKSKNNKLKKEIEKLNEQIEFLENKDFEKIITIKELRKEIRKLKKQIKDGESNER